MQLFSKRYPGHKSKLSELDPAKAMGADGIGPKVLKLCAAALCEPLCHPWCIPFEWKVHCITPIHKSGDKSIVSNYRPIALLSCVSKVLERLIYDNIIDYVSPFISSCQFGFVHGRATLQQLLIFLLDIFHNIDDKLQTDAIYLDLCKAFDSVPHDKLLIKLYFMGITGELWVWFKEYLSSRSQCVSINGTRSNTPPVILLVFPREAFSVHCYFLFLLMTFCLSSALSRYCYMLMIPNATTQLVSSQTLWIFKWIWIH